jgi:hypothetical protein
MRIAKELLTVWAFLILVFLVLTHFTGFEHDVRSISAGGLGLTKALQGRG